MRGETLNDDCDDDIDDSDDTDDSYDDDDDNSNWNPEGGNTEVDSR